MGIEAAERAGAAFDATVVAPAMHRVPHARTVHTGSVVRVGAVSVAILDHDPVLEIAATPVTGRP